MADIEGVIEGERERARTGLGEHRTALLIGGGVALAISRSLEGEKRGIGDHNLNPCLPFGVSRAAGLFRPFSSSFSISFPVLLYPSFSSAFPLSSQFEAAFKALFFRR
jgi:hypothetical protein